MKQLFILIFLFLPSIAEAADDWIKKTPLGQLPLARFGHGLAYIGDDKVLCFGGNGGFPGPYANDTWVYDLSENTWTNLNPPSPPSVRRDIAISYIGGDKVLLFGGYYPAYLGDTWLYTLSTNTWTQLTTVNSPGDRYSHELCYIGDDKVLLHGGVGDPGRLADLWFFDLSENTWTQIIPAGIKPSPRHYHEMCPISEDNVLLFGGYDTAHATNDTWLYNIPSNTWSELVPSGSIPSQRYEHAMVSIGDNKVMMFSGDGFQSGGYGDTWIFNLNDTTWTKDVNTINPPRLESHELSETCLDGTRCVVMFGGAASSGEINDTWTFGGGDYITNIQSEIKRLPNTLILEQNYPNPFNPITKISWQSPTSSWQTLKVYDVLGRKVATLVDEYRPAGTYEVEFNGSNLSSGVYFYQLRADEFIQSQKMILLK